MVMLRDFVVAVSHVPEEVSYTVIYKSIVCNRVVSDLDRMPVPSPVIPTPSGEGAEFYAVAVQRVVGGCDVGALVYTNASSGISRELVIADKARARVDLREQASFPHSCERCLYCW